VATSMPDAVIIPFRPRPSTVGRTHGLVHYVVRGRFERHRRRIDLHAHTPAEACRDAARLVAFFAEHSTGAYTRLVWQRGTIELFRDSCDEPFAKIADLPAHPIRPTIAAWRKKEP